MRTVFLLQAVFVTLLFAFLGATPLTLVVLVALLFLDALFYKQKLSDYGFRKPLAGSLDKVLFYLGLSALVALFWRIASPSFDLWYFPQLGVTGQNLPFFLVLQIPFIVLVEEIFARCLLQHKLEKAFDRGKAVWIAAVVFALLHWQWLLAALGYNTAYFLLVLSSALVYSYLFARLFYESRSVFATIALHLALNEFSALQLFFHAGGNFFLETLVWLFWFSLTLAVTFFSARLSRGSVRKL